RRKLARQERFRRHVDEGEEGVEEAGAPREAAPGPDLIDPGVVETPGRLLLVLEIRKPFEGRSIGRRTHAAGQGVDVHADPRVDLSELGRAPRDRDADDRFGALRMERENRPPGAEHSTLEREARAGQDGPQPFGCRLAEESAPLSKLLAPRSFGFRRERARRDPSEPGPSESL